MPPVDHGSRVNPSSGRRSRACNHIVIRYVLLNGWAEPEAKPPARHGGFLKTVPDKRELRMRRSNYGPLQWSLASPAAGTAARFRRWNILLIAILAFIVLGVFVAAEAPHTTNTSNATLRDSAGPSAQHANSNKNVLPPIHFPAGSAYPNKDTKSGHHAS